MENKGAPSSMSQSLLSGVTPFANLSSVSRRYWEHLFKLQEVPLEMSVLM